MEKKYAGCPLGGDTTNDCEGCADAIDYHFVNGECVQRGYESDVCNRGGDSRFDCKHCADGSKNHCVNGKCTQREAENPTECYKSMRLRHQNEMNSLPIHFAFGDEQIKRKFAELGLDPVKDADKITVIPGTGGFMLNQDVSALHEMSERHRKELQAAIASDNKGTAFIYQMFRYELANHEYGYTGETESTLSALGLSIDQIEANPALQHGFEKAKRDIDARF